MSVTAPRPAPLLPEQAFLRACALDVAVRKPGNVSHASPGHGMQAAQFLASARAAVGPLCQRGATVGARIEAAVQATQAVAGCNTNLGIVLLCAPLAAAAERGGELRSALQAVLAELTVDDAAAAFRAIALAKPGGLGQAPEADVHAPARVSLLQAMTLAAGRDRVARQYRDAFAECFTGGLQALPAGFKLVENPVPVSAVQAVFMAWLASAPDSHIVRKHGGSVAQNVMSVARRWRAGDPAAATLDTDPAFQAWDAELKAEGLNPGTSADLTVATLMLAGLLG
jgi:triphosphoribosyl-dephospho-CoA synthase